jgi:hypothetical protein
LLKVPKRGRIATCGAERERVTGRREKGSDRERNTEEKKEEKKKKKEKKR